MDFQNLFKLKPLFAPEVEPGGGRSEHIPSDDETTRLLERNTRSLDLVERNLAKQRERRKTREGLIQKELEILKEKTRKIEAEAAKANKTNLSQAEHAVVEREDVLKAEIELLREQSRRAIKEAHNSHGELRTSRDKVLEELRRVEEELFREKTRHLELVRRQAEEASPWPKTDLEAALAKRHSAAQGHAQGHIEPREVKVAMPAPQISPAPQPKPVQQPAPAPVAMPLPPVKEKEVVMPVSQIRDDFAKLSEAAVKEAPAAKPVAAAPEQRSSLAADLEAIAAKAVSGDVKSAIDSISSTIELELSNVKSKLGVKSPALDKKDGDVDFLNPFAKKGKEKKETTKDGVQDLTEVEVLDSKAKANRLLQTSSFFIAPDSKLDPRQQSAWADYKLKAIKHEISNLSHSAAKAEGDMESASSAAVKAKIPALNVRRFQEDQRRAVAAMRSSIEKLEGDLKKANELHDAGKNSATNEALLALSNDVIEGRIRKAAMDDNAEELLVPDKSLYATNVTRRFEAISNKNTDIINLVMYYIKQVSPLLEEARVTDEERAAAEAGEPGVDPIELEQRASQLSELVFTWNNIKRKFNLSQVALRNASDAVEEKKFLKAKNELSRYEILTEEFREERLWNALSNNLEALGVKKVKKVYQKKALWITLIVIFLVLAAGGIVLGVLHLQDILPF